MSIWIRVSPARTLLHKILLHKSLLHRRETPLTLEQWLELLEKRHPVKIDLQLERVARVAARLQVSQPAPTIISVAGTNGKGSCVAMLERLLVESGQRVGCFTSPHLLAFNERIRIQGADASNQDLCRVFELIEQARQEISLTYFEFNTLAALLLMREAELDVAVLEVGLGGRLDAVNIVDADVAVITSIDLDHTQWLGSERSQIALEKAGIARSGRPLLCADPDPPPALIKHIDERQVSAFYIEKDFVARHQANRQLNLLCCTADKQSIEFRDIPIPQVPLPSALVAVQALIAAGIVPTSAVVQRAFAGLRLAGRFQSLEFRGCRIIVDVAHNPAAARYLCKQLRALQVGRILMVAAVMADKDVVGFVEALQPLVNCWYLGDLPANPRALGADQLAVIVYNAGGQAVTCGAVVSALECALAEAKSTDLVVICGSFITAGAALAYMSPVSVQDE